MSRFGAALDIANAVLYEGYLLYPYTASATKNQYRWQFGVIAPRDDAGAGSGEPSFAQAEVLFEPDGTAEIAVQLRFLHVEERRIEEARGDGFVPVDTLAVDGATHLTFDEAVERDVNLEFTVSSASHRVAPIAIGDSERIETIRDAANVRRGRIVRQSHALHGTLAVDCAPVPGEDRLWKLRLRVENLSQVVAARQRSGVMRTAFLSAHALLSIDNGRFLSAIDPPEEAREASAALENRHVWPVLVGESAGDAHGAKLVLASPIILYDFPTVAERSERDAYDGTEIEELLRLSVLSLSDAERTEARATDPRARAIVDWAERLGPSDVAALHDGALDRFGGGARVPSDPFVTSDPLATLDVPALDCVFIEGTKIAKGSRVRLHPKRRADVWDTFLNGKEATVCAIHQDVDDQFYVAVTVDDDPASDLHEWYGRSFFFYPEEVEPLAPQRAG